MLRKYVTGLALLCAMLAGCDQRVVRDLSADPEYAALVGARYEIVGDLVAYGIKIDLQQPPDYIVLIPPPGIAGPEIAYTFPVDRGTEMTVLKIVKTNRLLDPGVTLFVRLSGPRLAVQLPVHVDLYRGNEGAAGVPLNPRIFRRIAS